MNIQSARILTDVSIRIAPRVSAGGYRFTELHHHWIENGERRKALSRVSAEIADTPHNRAYHLQAFLQRQKRTH
ncbi:hypothetical protein [Bradyrhizobium retamae]|uniref:Uncharacterized protein n=1 Tax=Bradyrhizobium retamae TaxID=1300035 RepID=A0A0R3MPB8_9BRAD|nr:hypothetical protein [Bradyrhizobium retamae]KRR21674.1 hypothetical protein CQ13_06385 [Bradyrhizobium retamae]